MECDEKTKRVRKKLKKILKSENNNNLNCFQALTLDIMTYFLKTILVLITCFIVYLSSVGLGLGVLNIFTLNEVINLQYTFCIFPIGLGILLLIIVVIAELDNKYNFLN